MRRIDKKLLIPIVIGIAIVIIAVIVFIAIGKSSSGNKDIKNVISFNATPEENNTVTNTENVSNDTNSIDIEEEEEEEKFDDEYYETYKEVCEKFALAYLSQEDMQELIDDYIDLKAYLAYQNIDGDETKFMDEYSSISDDDSEIESIENELLHVPQTIEMMKSLSEEAENVANATISTGNSTSNATSVDWDNLIEFVKITDIKVSEEIENIRHVTATFLVSEEEQENEFVFFDDILIYIVSEDSEDDEEDDGTTNGNVIRSEYDNTVDTESDDEEN